MIRVSKLNGRKVITANAYTLGEVDGARVDTGKWQITHFDISLTEEAARELGFKKPLLGSVKICLPVTLIQAVGDVITLSKPLPELKTLEECK